MKIRWFLPPYYIFFLFMIKNEICKSDENHISFLRQRFNLTVWNTIRQYIRCQTDSGHWTNETTLTTNTFNKTPSSQSPCDRNHKLNPYAHQGRCSSIFDGNSLHFSWNVPRTLCAHPLMKFNASHFCEIMQRLHGNIMFLGDSIQHEFAAEFTSALHIELGNRNQTMGCRTCYNLCNAADMHAQYCLKDAHSYVNYFNLSIDRNDYLLIPSNTQTNNFTHKSWVSALASNNIRLLIMNRGAHFKPTDEVLSDLNTTLSKVFKLFPEISVVWRNTPPGHHNFAEMFFSPPADSEPKFEEHLDVKYHYWNEFDEQNRAVENFLVKLFPQVLYLDFYTPTAFRMDSHVDFLHYCIPGPLSLCCITP